MNAAAGGLWGGMVILEPGDGVTDAVSLLFALIANPVCPLCEILRGKLGLAGFLPIFGMPGKVAVTDLHQRFVGLSFLAAGGFEFRVSQSELTDNVRELIGRRGVEPGDLWLELGQASLRLPKPGGPFFRTRGHGGSLVGLATGDPQCKEGDEDGREEES